MIELTNHADSKRSYERGNIETFRGPPSISPILFKCLGVLSDPFFMDVS